MADSSLLGWVLASPRGYTAALIAPDGRLAVLPGVLSMDADRFDTLARTLIGAGSRRRALGGALGGVLGLLGWGSADDAAAHDISGACKKKSGKARKKCLKKARAHNALHEREAAADPCAGVQCAPTPNGTAGCRNGACVITACDPGFRDCNRALVDGCETDVRADPTNCGDCGVGCPGGFPESHPVCAAENCGLICHGSVYDVDGDPTNGCEIRDDPSGQTLASAVDLGSKGCRTRTTFNGRIVSDARPHDPAPPGFDDTTGAAPNFWRAIATGGNSSQCPNGQKFDVIIATSGGSGSGPCYRLTVINGVGFVYGTRDVSGSGITGIHNVTYPSNADLIFKFEKICGTSVREDIDVTLDFVTQ